MIVEPYEQQVLRILCGGAIDNDILQSAIVKPESVSCKFTGAGYYLDLAHSGLPENRIVCDTPYVIGEYQGQDVGFLVFIENRAICLECYSYGNHGVPEEIRNGVVRISTRQK